MDTDTIQKLDPDTLAEVRRYNRDFFERMYSMGGATICLLNQHFPGLVVPSHVLDVHPVLVLEYDAEPVIPIPDLHLTDLGISATLSFDRAPCMTFVPWEAIDGMGCTRREDPPKPSRPALQIVP
jgi:hypothetical protein